MTWSFVRIMPPAAMTSPEPVPPAAPPGARAAIVTTEGRPVWATVVAGQTDGLPRGAPVRAAAMLAPANQPIRPPTSPATSAVTTSAGSGIPIRRLPFSCTVTG